MNKKYIIRFLKEGQRGAYTLLVEMYSEIITCVGPAMSLQIIRDDLQKESEEELVLNYSSLAHAIKKYKRKAETKSNVTSEAKMEKWEFLDAHEISEKHLTPGKFKLPQVDAGKDKESKSKAS
jgi:hypothetical protein